MKLCSIVFAGVVAPAAHGCITASPPSACRPLNKGTFSVNQYQLYPENADWDTKSCLVYFGALFNASVAVLDPYENKIVDILTFPNVTHNPDQHIGGVAADPYSGLLTVLTDAAAAFDTGGVDISGNNLLYKMDPAKKTILWTANLTAATGGKYGGFQDIEHDSRGNTYVVGSWPTSILRVDKNGNVTPWYVPAGLPTTQFGLAGLAAVFGTDILLANDNASGELYRFDMSQAQGTPTLVPRTPSNTTMGTTDAIYLPPRYGGTVMLAAADLDGTLVLRSTDQWKTAQQFSHISDNVTAAQGGFVPSNIEIAGTVYSVQEFFSDGVNPAIPSPGNRTEFPLVDITAEVNALISA
ncbi:hypothetical protein GQ53DRAFT_712506 [Thozetella sp. PMI_491]|nr:hypothetical protein GQ53DRAFT_712506 [Thozetella sp. PMI_491]